MAISLREERSFRKRYGNHLKLLKELSVSNAEEVAALLAVAEIISSIVEKPDEKVDVNIASAS